MIDRIVLGDARSILAQMADRIVQTCITSPPYWGLRDYGLEPVVWDGDSDCEHEWDNHHQAPRGGKCTQCNTPNTGGNRAMQEMGSLRGEGIDSSFCRLCGAWRGSLGLEPTPELYIDHLVQIFRQVWRVLRDDGTLWLNIGDSYAGGNRGGNPDDSPFRKQATNRGSLVAPTPIPPGSVLKPKDMVLIPFRLALALQADGWWVRSDIIWHKPSCMPSSVTDRPTTDFEHVFLLAKSKKYFYDQDAIREPMSEATRARDQYSFNGAFKGQFGGTPGEERWQNGRPIEQPRFYSAAGRNKRTVWSINPKPYAEAHFATFPPKLVEPMILAGSAEGDIVLDPFAGSGTTCAVAKEHRRRYIGIEANPEYITMAEKRIAEVQPLMF